MLYDEEWCNPEWITRGTFQPSSRLFACPVYHSRGVSRILDTCDKQDFVTDSEGFVCSRYIKNGTGPVDFESTKQVFQNYVYMCRACSPILRLRRLKRLPVAKIKIQRIGTNWVRFWSWCKGGKWLKTLETRERHLVWNIKDSFTDSCDKAINQHIQDMVKSSGLETIDTKLHQVYDDFKKICADDFKLYLDTYPFTEYRNLHQVPVSELNKLWYYIFNRIDDVNKLCALFAKANFIESPDDIDTTVLLSSRTVNVDAYAGIELDIKPLKGVTVSDIYNKTIDIEKYDPYTSREDLVHMLRPYFDFRSRGCWDPCKEWVQLSLVKFRPKTKDQVIKRIREYEQSTQYKEYKSRGEEIGYYEEQ